MKQLLSLALYFICFLITSFAQNPEWIHYTNGNRIWDIEAEYNIIWALTDFELVKINTLSGITTFYDKSNSGMEYGTILEIDKFGNKWIGDYDHGLVKFDNTSWTIYDTTDSEFLKGYISCITSDDSGNLWIGTYDNGLVKFDGTNWTNYNSSNYNILSNYISLVKIDDFGNVWIVYVDQGIYKLATFNGNDFITVDYNASIIDDIEFNDSEIWLGTHTGLLHFNGEEWITYNRSNSGLLENVVDNLELDDAGNIWIGHDGLVKFDGQDWFVFNHLNSDLPSNRIHDIEIGDSQNLWVGTDDEGLVMFDGTNWKVYNTSKSGLPTNVFECLTINNNNKWIASDESLIKFDGTTFEEHNYPESILPIFPSCIEFDNQNNIWIGLRSGSGGGGMYTQGLVKFDGTNFIHYTRSAIGLLFEEVTSLSVDYSNNLWAGTDAGLVKYSGSEWKTYTKYNSDLLESGVLSIKIDNFDNKWILTENRLYMLNFGESEWIIYNDLKSSIDDFWKLNDLEIDSENNIWIISHTSFSNEGVALTVEKFDVTNSILYTDGFTKEISWGFQLSSAIDMDDNIWIASGYHGLRKFDGNNWSGYNEESSDLPLPFPYLIEIDGSNNKWIGPIGLLVFYVEGIVSVKDESNKIESTPTDFSLEQNYPNPFNPTTTIQYSIPKQSNVTLKLFDVLGSEVAILVNKEQPQGNYEIEFDASDLSNDVYFYILKAGDYVETKKMILLK